MNESYAGGRFLKKLRIPVDASILALMKNSSLIRSGVVVLAVLVASVVAAHELTKDHPSIAGWGAPPDQVLDFGVVQGDVKPLPSNATSIAEGVESLRRIAGVGDVIDAIEQRDVEALLALFELSLSNCADFRHDSTVSECEALNGEPGSFQAIGIEDGGSHWMLAEVRARQLLTAVLVAEPIEIVLAARESNTPEGLGGVYYLAFSTHEFDASDEAFNYASDTVGTGFGLKVVSRGDHPIIEFSLISPNWQPLQWLGIDGYSAPHDVSYVLLFPRELEGYFHRRPAR
jgi:hypothetical protein